MELQNRVTAVGLLLSAWPQLCPHSYNIQVIINSAASTLSAPWNTTRLLVKYGCGKMHCNRLIIEACLQIWVGRLDIFSETAALFLTAGLLASCCGRSPPWRNSLTRACPTSKCCALSWREDSWISPTTALTCCKSALHVCDREHIAQSV